LDTEVVAALAVVFGGLVILRTVRSTIDGVRAAAIAALGWTDTWSIAVCHAPSARLAALPVASPAATHLFGAIHGRGPLFSL